jgi:tetratricopeptide (TPR) repeat protein
MTTACRACGAPLPTSATQCPACGSATPAGSTAATLPPEPAIAAPPSFSTTPRASSAPTLPPEPAVTAPPVFGMAIRPSAAATLPPGPDPAPPTTRASTAATLPPSSGLPDDAPATVLPPPAALSRAQTHAGGAQARPGEHGPLSPGQSFGRRYHIKKLLGLGGMGAVYQAWDTELSVEVAIKLIRPEIMANPAAAAEIQRRFKRELLLARLVTHKNVVRIHDLGEIDGIKYITMSYVDGTDLATILSKEAKLTVPRALRIMRRVCSGLVAAHSAGVVHRDLKPANVMVSRNDDALIMDFGIAKLSDAGAASGGGDDVDTGIREAFTPASGNARMAGMTRLGSMVGTVEYVPPEQAKGEPVDQRADVYAFGLMFYDMVAGTVRADLSDSPLAELESRLKSGPPPLKKLAPDVPDALATLIQRCVEPDKAKRLQTSADVKAALNRLDENGRKIPAWKTMGTARLAGVAAGVLALTSATWWWFRPPPVAPERDPVSVLIADFGNATRDAAFDRAVEPVMKLSLEGAKFITAFARADVRRGLGVPVPEVLDEKTAREIAVKQGLNVVLSGKIAPEGRGYRLSVTARQAVTGEVIVSVESTAASKEAVLRGVGELAADVRQALGDDTSDTKQRFAMETLTATSLDVVHDYAVAMEALAGSRFEEAKENFAKAVQADPNFGLAYGGMAVASQNVGNQSDARKYATEALKRVDRMTERERYRTRGQYYLITADYPSCVKEYGALIAKFQADPAARNNLALCSTRLRDMTKALSEMKQAVRILPNRALYRVNLALYAAYASDFATALAEAEKAKALSPLGHVPLGFAQMGLGQFDEAAATFDSFAEVNALGASHAASARGDLAVYQGRYADAVRILEKGAAVDLEAKNADRAAAKFGMIAYAEQSRGRKPAALWNARRALQLSATPKIRFLGARLLAQEGELDDARRVAEELAEDLQVEPRVYGKILQGELLLAAKQPRAAVDVLTEANGMLDTWIGRFTLGRAYVDLQAWPQADSEFDRCSTRRGEALALFLDEEPTFGFFPQVLYWQGRTREGLGAGGFVDSYRLYESVRGPANEDVLLSDVRRRLAGGT